MDASFDPNATLLDEVELGFRLRDIDANWSVLRVELREGLSELYHGTFELAVEGLDEPIEALLGQRALASVRRDAEERRVCGVVIAAEDLGYTSAGRLVRLEIVPALWLLSQRSDWRIYQDVDAVEVVAAVLKSAGIYQQSRGVRRRLAGGYARREYCVQFGETDLAFVLRLLEHEGIAFYFTHDSDDGLESLVLADDSAHPFDAWSLPDGDGQLPIAATGEPRFRRHAVWGFAWGRASTSTAVLQRDFYFMTPRATHAMTSVQPTERGARVRYDYPGHWTFDPAPTRASEAPATAGASSRPHDGRRLTRRRFEAERLRSATGTGETNVVGLQPGQTFRLRAPERPEVEQEYLVTRVVHTITNHDEGLHASDGNATQAPRYSNTITVSPTHADGERMVFRPALRTPRARVSGPQTATVVAEPDSSEEICVDVHGRILVQFHWDRPELRVDAQSGTKSSCWVRVAQSWAGAQWGAMVIPRVGMEVVVQFLDGDPDRPLVTGCVYNGAHPPPLRLPEERTRSTFRTNSSPGGDGHNELMFEDLAGSEQVYLHAQKDLIEVVRHDHSTHVMNNQQNHVDVDQDERVGANQTLHVCVDRTKTVDANERVTVGQNRTESVGQNETHTIGQNRSAQVGQNETLKVGGTQTTLVERSRLARVSGGDSLEVKGARRIEVKSANRRQIKGLDSGKFQGGRSAVVKGVDHTLVMGGSSTEVVGAHAVTALLAQVLTVFPTTVALTPGKLDASAPSGITLKAGSAKIEMAPSSIVIDNGAGAKIEMVGGTLKLTAPLIEIQGGLVKINC